ncbi:biotin/lipoate A/B protein ligase [Bifidobacterium stellenboschense]|uniref:Biotin/lipoate A/B protein ligase n=2 Tax=Bifidobacterium stellenboschense TaxID=762211 RepID=A0A087DWX7_9BIFI|nr:biotin/lipoate A/B protein ligase [Bifidobacterium stellenboschense]
MVRGECKTPGGKLVAVTVEPGDAPTGASAFATAGGAVASRVRVDGDFFVDADSDEHADALLRDIERALAAIAADSATADADSQDSTTGTDAGPIRGCGSGDDSTTVETTICEAIARHPHACLVGTDATAIAIAYTRALTRPPSSVASAASSLTSPPLAGAPAQRVGVVPSVTTPAAPSTPDFASRWASLWPRLAIVHDRPRTPDEQMAIDERWAREVAAGTRPPTLRIWEWSAPCVVVGRFQSIPDEVHESVARAEGITVVRRCTGGGAMFIEPGNTITYSLYTPLDFVAGIDVASSYRLCDRWLVEALRGLGLDVRFAGLNDIASQYGKIGGAAQRRFPAPHARGGAVAPGAVLHHVTMAYDIDAVKMTRVLNVSGEKTSDKAVKSAVKRVDPLRSQTGMTRAEVVAHLLAYCRAQASRA